MLYIYVRVLSKVIGKFAAKVNTYFSLDERISREFIIFEFRNNIMQQYK